MFDILVAGSRLFFFFGCYLSVGHWSLVVVFLSERNGSIVPAFYSECDFIAGGQILVASSLEVDVAVLETEASLRQ